MFHRGHACRQLLNPSVLCTGSNVKPHDAFLFAQGRRNRVENTGCMIPSSNHNNCTSPGEFPSPAAALFSSFCYFPSSSFVVVNPTIKLSFRSRPFRGETCLHNSERKRIILYTLLPLAVRGHMAGRERERGFPKSSLTRRNALFTIMTIARGVICVDVIRDLYLS